VNLIKQKKEANENSAKEKIIIDMRKLNRTSGNAQPARPGLKNFLNFFLKIARFNMKGSHENKLFSKKKQGEYKFTAIKYKKTKSQITSTKTRSKSA
jgi:hypothetical protein